MHPRETLRCSPSLSLPGGAACRAARTLRQTPFRSAWENEQYDTLVELVVVTRAQWPNPVCVCSPKAYQKSSLVVYPMFMIYTSWLMQKTGNYYLSVVTHTAGRANVSSSAPAERRWTTRRAFLGGRCSIEGPPAHLNAMFMTRTSCPEQKTGC